MPMPPRLPLPLSMSSTCPTARARSALLIDPSEDGAEIVNGVADRVRAELFRRIGLEDLLKPHVKG